MCSHYRTHPMHVLVVWRCMFMDSYEKEFALGTHCMLLQDNIENEAQA